MMVGGVFNVVTFLVVNAMHTESPAFDVWARVDEYLKLWTWPAALKFRAADQFNPQRVSSYRAARTIKCPASDGLSILPVMVFFMQAVVIASKVAIHECQCFLALADLIEALQAIPLGLISGPHLRRCVSTISFSVAV